MNSPPGRIIFITGTDTGSGKTLLTALLLVHLRGSGLDVLAMKPFCSGDKADIALLQSLQPGEISDDLMNPFFFRGPVAPLVAARKQNRIISFQAALQAVEEVSIRCDYLLVEGIGGVLVPLGPGYNVLDLIHRLGCVVIVAARNKIGVINQSLLTMRALNQAGLRQVGLVLMGTEIDDASSTSNHLVLRELLAPIEVVPIPFLGLQVPGLGCAAERSCQKLKNRLRVLDTLIFSSCSLDRKPS